MSETAPASWCQIQRRYSYVYVMIVGFLRIVGQNFQFVGGKYNPMFKGRRVGWVRPFFVC